MLAGPALHALLLEGVEDHHEPVRIGVRQRPYQDAVDHTEHSCICTDAQREGTERGESESGSADQRANAITDVSHQIVKGIHVPHITTLLFALFDAPEAGQLDATP